MERVEIRIARIEENQLNLTRACIEILAALNECVSLIDKNHVEAKIATRGIELAHEFLQKVDVKS